MRWTLSVRRSDLGASISVHTGEAVDIGVDGIS
jgi:hypothetical protein